MPWHVEGHHAAMLDPRLLRSFVGIIDAQSFTAAADRLSMTQSTISQQLARLEEQVGSALVDRTARPIVATAAGERLLGYARRILALQQEAQAALGDPAGTAPLRIGVPEDLVNAAMAATFRDFSRRHREIHLDVTDGLSRDLTQRYRGGEFDIVIVKEAAAGPDCRSSFPEPMAWFESLNAPRAWPSPVPLVTFPPGGLYRDAMFERLERERLRWYNAFSGSSLHNVLIAVEAGIGLSLLPRNAVTGYRVRPYARFPAEAPIVVSIYAREREGIVGELVELLQTVLERRQGGAPGAKARRPALSRR